MLETKATTLKIFDAVNRLTSARLAVLRSASAMTMGTLVTSVVAA